MEIIGKIKVKKEGKEVFADLTDEGFVVFEDKSTRKIPPEQFEKVKKKLEKERQKQVEKEQSQPVSQSIQPKPQTVDNTPQRPPAPAEPKQYDVREERPVQQPQPQTRQHDRYTVQNPSFPEKKNSAKKKMDLNGLATFILSAILGIIVLGFVVLSSGGLITIGPKDDAIKLLGPGETINLEALADGTGIKGVGEADTVLIVARVISPEGDVKEATLGYVTKGSTPEFVPENMASTTPDKSSDEVTLPEKDEPIKVTPTPRPTVEEAEDKMDANSVPESEIEDSLEDDSSLPIDE